LYQFTPNLQGFLLPHTIHNIRLLLRLGIPVQKLFKITYPHLTEWYSFMVSVRNGIIKLYNLEVKGKEIAN